MISFVEIMRRILPILLLLALGSCLGRDPDIRQFSAPVIQDVFAAGGADHSQVVVLCRLSTAEGIKDYGIYFGKDEWEKIPASNLQDNAFSVTVTGLAYSTEYHYKAYVDGGRGYAESEVRTWKTEDEIPPVAEIIKAVPGMGADAGKVTFSCFIRNLATTIGKDALTCGICYAPEGKEPTLDGPYATAEFSPAGNYTVSLEGLVTSITYGFRPFTQIGQKTTFGETLTRKIPSGEEVVLSIGYSGLTHNSVTMEGALHQEEWMESVSYGFEWNGKMALADRIDESHHFTLSRNDLLPETDYRFRAVAVVDGTRYQGEEMSFRTPALPGTDVGYVDLGLSVLWGTFDLGATKYLERGDVFAWGETTTKDSYEWSTYKWCLGSDESIFKYSLSVDTPQADGKTSLDPADDAAHVILGGKWRMPTAAEFLELLKNCEVTQPKTNGVFFLTSKVSGFSDRSIYLDNQVYWTSNLCPGLTKGAIVLSPMWGGGLPLLLYSIPSNRPDYEFPYLDYIIYRYRPNLIRPVRER